MEKTLKENNAITSCELNIDSLEDLLAFIQLRELLHNCVPENRVYVALSGIGGDDCKGLHYCASDSNRTYINKHRDKGRMLNDLSKIIDQALRADQFVWKGKHGHYRNT